MASKNHETTISSTSTVVEDGEIACAAVSMASKNRETIISSAAQVVEGGEIAYPVLSEASEVGEEIKEVIGDTSKIIEIGPKIVLLRWHRAPAGSIHWKNWGRKVPVDGTNRLCAEFRAGHFCVLRLRAARRVLIFSTRARRRALAVSRRSWISSRRGRGSGSRRSR